MLASRPQFLASLVNSNPLGSDHEITTGLPVAPFTFRLSRFDRAAKVIVDFDCDSGAFVMRRVRAGNRAARSKSELAARRVRTIKRPVVFSNVPSKLRFVAAAVVLCALGVVAYANSLNNGFVWDDHEQVVMNSGLRPGAPLLHLFAAKIWGFTHPGDHKHGNYYRPLQMVTYRLTAYVFGFDARAFHAVNLAFHVIVVLVAFALFFRLTGRIGMAFAAGALFAVHPIHSEAVGWIAALPDIGCTVFFLLAFLLLVLARGQISPPQQTEPSRHNSILYVYMAASYAAFAVALLWKESAIVFPLIVMAYVFCLCEVGAYARRIRGTLKLSLPYWAILGAYFLLRLRVLGFVVTSQRNWILSRFEFGLTALNLILAYWWKLLAPVHLNAYYVFSPIRTLQDPRAIAAILLLILAANAIVCGLRRAPLASFAALWVFVTLIPVLNVYAVGRNVFAERYLYLPSVGFSLLIVLVASWAGRWLPVRFRLPATALALAAVLLPFTERTFARNPVWKDDSELFTRTLDSSPNAPFVQNMVAAVQPNNATGQISAESHYLRAISLGESEVPPDRLEMAIAGKGLASIYAARGDFDRALKALAQVRVADPQDPEVDGEEGLILTQAGRWTEAEAALRRAVAIIPNDANVLNALGLFAWQHAGHLDEAAASFSRALAVHTDADDFNASLHSNLGAVYGEQGRFSDAIAQFQIALQIEPNDPEYLTNLATAFEAVGRIDDARREIQAALAVAPDYSPARVALARLHSHLNRVD
jgi:Flp pilus assembly protein TadD